MSALASRPPGEATACPHCGARFVPGQDWCLECGTAVNIRIRPAPDWRVPVAIVGGVVILVVVVLVLTLNAASDSANRSVPAILATAPVHHHRAPSAPSSPKLPVGPTVGSWPAGVTGYTVVLGVIHDRAAATADARRIAVTGVPVGVLFSSDYSSMRPGDWIVFSGTYPSKAEADTAAASLKARGQPGAYAFSVVPTAGAAATGTATTGAASTTGAATTTTP